jgi:hypothetical protein
MYEVVKMPKARKIPPRFKAPTKHTFRSYLSMDSQLTTARRGFDHIPDHRRRTGKITLSDGLMSVLAMFILKDSSLLAFDDRRQTDVGNLERIFGIKQPPCDTHMRELLDPVNPELLRPLFSAVFSQLQRGKALEPLAFYQGHYLLSMDGTGSFSSKKLKSDSCSVKKHRNGTETYYQQVLGVAIVHPDFQEVIPLCPEMVQKQDGAAKNDCERNAARRLLPKLRKDHPRLKLIVIEDGLSSNGPHIKDLTENDMRFILGAKPGDHPLLFHHVEKALEQGTATVFSLSDPKEPRITHTFRFLNGVPLNQANQKLMVNFLGYEEHDARINKTTHFSWVTDLTITSDNAFTLMRGARARWKIENETFNTLKNQGYNLEHNYGLGKEHLSEVFVMLMMLAFLIDQTQQLTSTLFQAAWQKVGSKRALWEKQRNLFHCFELDSMSMLYTAIVNGFRARRPEIIYDDA